MKVPRGLFINPEKQRCSIHESGVMIYNCLKNSTRFTLDYKEVSKDDRTIPDNYDFYAFNYHVYTMGWLNTDEVWKLPGLKLTFVLEVAPDNAFAMTPDEWDVYCVLDPTFTSTDKRMYSFPRPLESFRVPPYEENGITVGTFGFLTPGKGYDKVVEACAKEFTKATVRINVPVSPNVGKTWSQDNRLEVLRNEIKPHLRDGIEVVITQDYMTKEELVTWCSQNTLNCFLYDRKLPGLAATTDQCIASGRPLAVSGNETFRHIHQYVRPYPEWSLKESIIFSGEKVKDMQYAWSPETFCILFERVLNERGLFKRLHMRKEPVMIDLPRISDWSVFKKRMRYFHPWGFIKGTFRNRVLKKE